MKTIHIYVRTQMRVTDDVADALEADVLELQAEIADAGGQPGSVSVVPDDVPAEAAVDAPSDEAVDA